MSECSDKLREIVKDYAANVESAVAGDLYDVDGENVTIADLDEWRDSAYGEKVREYRKSHPDASAEEMEDEIGTVDDIDDPEPVSLSDYLDETSLGDVVFEVDMDRNVRGGRILVAYGGPNVWIHDDEIRGYWGTQASWSLSSKARQALLEYFEELWDSGTHEWSC